MTRLFDYFGFVGVASILLWIATLAFLGVYAFHKPLRISMLPRVALLTALASLVLGLVNSSNVSAIEVVREETPTQEPEVKAKTLDTMKRRRDEINMPDGTPAESLDKPASYDYRQRGKVERDSGASLGQAPPAEGGAEESKATTKPAGSATQPTTKPAAEPRRMPGIDVSRANRYDGININAIRMTLGLVFLSLVYDFLRRLNQTAERVIAMPFTGAWLDVIAPKSRAAWIVTPKPASLAKSLATHIARKGETFIVIGGESFASRSLPATSIGTHACRLPVMNFGPGCEPYPDRFLAEAVSFARAGAATNDAPCAIGLCRAIDTMAAEKRLPTHAARTVNVIWAVSPVASVELARMIETAEERNHKVIVIATERPAGDDARRFVEIISCGAALPRPWCEPVAQMSDAILTWMFSPPKVRSRSVKSTPKPGAA